MSVEALELQEVIIYNKGKDTGDSKLNRVFVTVVEAK